MGLRARGPGAGSTAGIAVARLGRVACDPFVRLLSLRDDGSYADDDPHDYDARRPEGCGAVVPCAGADGCGPSGMAERAVFCFGKFDSSLTDGSMIKVTLPDGKELELEAGATARDGAERIGPRAAAAAVAAQVNG